MCGRAPILAEHTLGRRAESTPYPHPLNSPELPAPCSLLPISSVTKTPRSESFLTPPVGGLTSAGVMLITMKMLRTCYTTRPSGPPRLVGLGHDCCDVQRCVDAMAVMSALATRHASRLAISS